MVRITYARTPAQFVDLNNFPCFSFRIWRNYDKSDVHIFTSHFYTTLLNEGPAGLSKWTQKKGMNVFEKKFVFIPSKFSWISRLGSDSTVSHILFLLLVNISLHWSLCVVVNPGNPNTLEDKLYPFLLFFDSLQVHDETTVASKVQDWLTAEWKRLNKAIYQEFHEPFQKEHVLISSPKGEFFRNTSSNIFSLVEQLTLAYYCVQFPTKTTPGIAEFLYADMVTRCLFSNR
jgi:hypothetical protein